MHHSIQNNLYLQYMKRALLILFLSPLLAYGQIITTVAGSGTAGYSGNGGPATAAELHGPSDIAIDAYGNLYICDLFNSCIRKVDTAGVITTVAGIGTNGYNGDGIPATDASLYYPQGIAFDGAGNLIICDNNNYRVRMVNSAGIISTIAGNGVVGYTGLGGPATDASIWPPLYAALDPTGNIYFTAENNVVMKINSAGTLITAAGNDTAGFSGDGGPATNAEFNGLYGIALDSLGNIYLSDHANNRIRKVDASGNVNTVSGTAVSGYSGDGLPFDSAVYAAPLGLSIDSAGNMYICDEQNYRVRKVGLSDTINSIAGNGISAYTGNGGPATAASFINPYSARMDKHGNLYIADVDANVIRKVFMPDTVTLSVKNKESTTMAVSVFPNPATASVTVTTRSTEGQIDRISIINFLGQTIYKQSCFAGMKSLTIDCLSFPPGVYFVKVNGTEVRKFVKQ